MHTSFRRIYFEERYILSRTDFLSFHLLEYPSAIYRPLAHSRYYDFAIFVHKGKRIAGSILSSIDERTRIIASSDFTHYGPSYGFTPYGPEAYGRVMDEDSRTAQLFAENKAEEAWEDGRKRTICGIAPAAIASMIAGSLCLEGNMVMASSSADSNGDRTDFVSYRTVLWR